MRLFTPHHAWICFVCEPTFFVCFFCMGAYRTRKRGLDVSKRTWTLQTRKGACLSSFAVIVSPSRHRDLVYCCEHAPRTTRLVGRGSGFAFQGFGFQVRQLCHVPPSPIKLQLSTVTLNLRLTLEGGRYTPGLCRCRVRCSRSACTPRFCPPSP